LFQEKTVCGGDHAEEDQVVLMKVGSGGRKEWYLVRIRLSLRHDHCKQKLVLVTVKVRYLQERVFEIVMLGMGSGDRISSSKSPFWWG